jgi:alkanesulfonate monooxygenase SsuD/methylene tetrahydromethanopterin reductase-like flavin-dependent oxidoreductase (luciferase family)
MRYGVVLPGGRPSAQVAQARLAEQAGWDGVFVPELAYGVDAWTLLAAMAAATSRVRLGTVITPLPWRRPWKVASEVATVDQLSGGRAILGVGVGAVDPALPDAGEETDLRVRADMLDEGIDLARALWSGGGGYQGRYYRFTATPDEVARPGGGAVPIWVVGVWPRPKSLRRALRCDGVIAQFTEPHSAEDVRGLRSWLTDHGGPATLDVVVDGETPADHPAAAHDMVAPLAEAGATWWLETRWTDPAEIGTRVAAGPPGQR